MRRLVVALLGLTILAAAVGLLARPGVQASPDTITVTSNADPGDGTCDVAQCTLREAINAANASSGADTIVFDPTAFPPGAPATITTTDPPLPALTAGGDTVDASGAGVILDAQHTALRITSDGNIIKGFDLISSELAIGIDIDGGLSNTIGGSSASDRNVVSDCDIGIRIRGGSANVVKGNYIGTDGSGTVAVPNRIGVFLDNGANNNTIGGTTDGERNVISGNRLDPPVSDPGAGVLIAFVPTRENTVIGNYIGVDATGTAALPNDYGVQCHSGPYGNVIGGMSEGERNVISGNIYDGIRFDISCGSGNTVKGNYVGLDASGVSALPNHDGVNVRNGGVSTIGGRQPGEGNRISGNTSHGVRVEYSGVTATISGNSIHSNGFKGIENWNGGNRELAPPIIDNVGGSVSGHTSPKCYPCTVEVFSDSEDEGRIYHGATTTNDDATGTWTYTRAVTGPHITATVTDDGGNTSEFSAPLAYYPPVGGIAHLPDASGSTGLNYIALAGLGAALVALTAGALYARRRWER